MSLKFTVWKWRKSLIPITARIKDSVCGNCLRQRTQGVRREHQSVRLVTAAMRRTAKLYPSDTPPPGERYA